MNFVPATASHSPMRALLLVATLAAPCFAQTVYSWEDGEGVHYTDDPTQVPARATKRSEQKYERSVAPKTTQVSVAVNETAERERNERAENTRRREQAERASEQSWRQRFVAAHLSIASQKDLLARLRAALPASPTVCSQALVGRRGMLPCAGNGEYERQTARIATEQSRLDDFERQLEQLDREASYASVPREWRRGF